MAVRLTICLTNVLINQLVLNNNNQVNLMVIINANKFHYIEYKLDISKSIKCL